MDAITKMVMIMYRTNQQVFKNTARFVLRKFYSIPVEEDDLILGCLQQLIIKGKEFKPTEQYSLEKYLYSNIKYIMYSYCRTFTRKNNVILNNYVDFDLMENFKSQTYNYSELNLEYLSKLQKSILDDLYIGKSTIRQIAVKNTTTSFAIKKQIKEIQKIIINQIENSTDF
jgi:hypothetical protein